MSHSPFPYDFSSLAFATTEPSLSGVMRTEPDDFQVVEQIAYELSGEGEHLWCWVRKEGENTEWVAKELAKWAGISRKNVGVAGQKDRHAVTWQWFSVWLPGKENPSLEAWNHESVVIEKCIRHHRKLQTGGLSGNRFSLRLRDLNSETTFSEALTVLQQKQLFIEHNGVPNYFGEQRFGFNGKNLERGLQLTDSNRRVSRNQRSLYLSALRSWPFNVVLSERLKQGLWKKLLTGDALNLEGSSKWFSEDGDETLQQRIESNDLHITGPMIGEAAEVVTKDAKDFETAILQGFEPYFDVMRSSRMKEDRRAFVMLIKDLEISLISSESQTQLAAKKLTLQEVFENCSQSYPQDCPLKDYDLLLNFSLPAGSYATMVLRELIKVSEPDRKTVNKEATE